MRRRKRRLMAYEFFCDRRSKLFIVLDDAIEERTAVTELDDQVDRIAILVCLVQLAIPHTETQTHVDT